MRKVRSAAASGLVLVTPMAAAALASAILGGGTPAAQTHQPHSTLVNVLSTTVRTAASEPKIPAAAGD